MLFAEREARLAQREAIVVPALRKLPADAGDMLLARGEWSNCAMEHSRIGAVELAEAGAPFHHIALHLEARPLRFAFRTGGRSSHARSARDQLAMIEAGTVATSSWDDEMESACLYFTDEALARVLGIDTQTIDHRVRSGLEHRDPRLAWLIRTLHGDLRAHQPHGKLIGDGIFMAIAAHLAPKTIPRVVAGQAREPWRIRNALAFIHSHLEEKLSIGAIATAAATSSFYLNHSFRRTLDCSIWQYVLRARAERAVQMIAVSSSTLSQIAVQCGFETHRGFAMAVRNLTGYSPSQMRAQLQSR